ncbi:MAG: tRNA (adenosine(37)-N6)-threonylcarbamoyltransferase complex transferase subunit TsaD [Candidatus Micrarchaeota archaeon]|nr:tRNA (adenosine(37)-N6)-threonylcarbamoyltransferase complex transferase subunit TsaD [Candidatus Micrarchaeota archaeon]
MRVLGIESSAHTFGVGIVEEGKVIANEKMMFKVTNKGMIPGKVAETHITNAAKVVALALKAAKLKIGDIEGVGYTRGPGLGPCLQVGEMTAKTIANKLGVKIAQVNHGAAHAEISRDAAKMRDPLILYVSGGNSQILKLAKTPFRHYAILGETFDIGVGNMMDTFAREVGLNPAWGSTVAKIGEGGEYTKLPYTVKGMDFAFTGLLTHAIKKAQTEKIEDLCYSIQETAFSMLCEATERAIFLTDSKELCVCGGVAQSRRLREMLFGIAKTHKIKFGYAADAFNADNGAMIAFVAERMLRNGIHSRIEECGIEQRYRIDRAVIV